jgi:hypothetical protein
MGRRPYAGQAGQAGISNIGYPDRGAVEERPASDTSIAWVLRQAIDRFLEGHDQHIPSMDRQRKRAEAAPIHDAAHRGVRR